MKKIGLLFLLLSYNDSLYAAVNIHRDTNTLSESSVIIDGSGNLIITDKNDGISNDQLTLQNNNGHLRITDPFQTFSVSGKGVSLVNSHTVDVSLSSFTGGLIIDTKLGNDVLNFDSDLILSGEQKIQVRGITTLNQNARISFVDGEVDYQVSDAINFSQHAALNGSGSGDVIFTSIGDLNIDGTVQNTLSKQKGRIILQGGDEGEVRIAGSIDASASDGGIGGVVHVLGQKVGLFDSAKIDVSGKDAGTVLLGGDLNGQNDNIQNAEFTYVSENAVIKADGGHYSGGHGNGGQIIVFAENTTRVFGSISAKGGFVQGDGGLVETSGMLGFHVENAPDTSAMYGEAGQWLIDPYNITIGFAVNNAISGASPFTPSASGANLNISTLMSALNLGNVIIDTAGAGIEDGDITLNGDLDFASATASNDLILNADGDIFINGSILNSSAIPVNKLDDLNLNADRNNDGIGDVVFNDNLFSQLQIDISGDLTIGSDTQDVKFENVFGGLIFANNIDIGSGTSTADRIDGEVIFKPGDDGFDVYVFSNTLDIFANGDVDLDASGTSNRVEITSFSSQRIFADDVIINAGGSGQTGFAVTSVACTQEFNTGGDLNLDVATGNQDAVVTSAGSQDLTIRGTLSLQSNANAVSKVTSNGNQTIATGVANPGLTSIDLNGTTAGRVSLISSLSTQNINTNGGSLIVDLANVQSAGIGSITTGKLDFSRGLIDLSGGTFTIDGAPTDSTIYGVFNAQFLDVMLVNDSGSTINHNTGSLILTNSTFNNLGTFNNQGGTLQLDVSTFNNNATANLSSGAFDLNLAHFVNEGTFNWSGSPADIGLDSDSTWINNISGIINDSATSSFTSPASNFVNNGTYNNNSGVTALNTNFENNGTVTSGGTGMLQVNGNLSSNGDFNLEDRLDISGNASLNSGTLNSTGDITVAGNWTTAAGVNTNMPTSGGQLILDGNTLQTVTQNDLSLGSIIVNNTGVAMPTVRWNDAIASQGTVTLNDVAVSLNAGGTITNNLTMTSASRIFSSLQINSLSTFDALSIG